ncbi:MAG: hypothetical protein R2815_13985 [Flavobacteriales bacterium]
MTSNAMNNRWLRWASRLCASCLLLIAPRCEAQNLIYNPSFEEIDSCPQLPILGFGPGERPNGWFTVNSSPDYFNRCQSYGNYGGVPLNIGGWQEPFDGDAYSGMWTYFQNSSLYHEIIGTELLEPLTEGMTYYLSFYINAAAGGSEWPMLASSHYGALFAMDAVEWENWMPSLPLRNYAQVYSPTVMSDTTSWLLVSGSFVADSAYRYMLLGNHFDNQHAEADTIITRDSTAYLYRAYTYVDQVCLSVDPSGCPMAQNVLDQEADGALVFPNPATDELSITGLGWGTVVTIWDAVRSMQWIERATGERLQLNVSGWSRGCYVAVIENGGGRRSIKFVLIE